LVTLFGLGAVCYFGTGLRLSRGGIGVAVAVKTEHPHIVRFEGVCGQAHARYARPFWASFCGCCLMSVTPVAAADPPRFPDVAKLPSRPALPDPLVMLDGEHVTTAEQWTQQRRPELKALFEYYMYGVAPPAPEHPKFTVERVEPRYF